MTNGTAVQVLASLTSRLFLERNDAVAVAGLDATFSNQLCFVKAGLSFGVEQIAAW